MVKVFKMISVLVVAHGLIIFPAAADVGFSLYTTYAGSDLAGSEFLSAGETSDNEQFFEDEYPAEQQMFYDEIDFYDPLLETCDLIAQDLEESFLNGNAGCQPAFPESVVPAPVENAYLSMPGNVPGSVCPLYPNELFDNTYPAMYERCIRGEFDDISDDTDEIYTENETEETFEGCGDDASYQNESSMLGDWNEGGFVAADEPRGFTIQIVPGSEDMNGARTDNSVAQNATESIDRLKETLKDYNLRVDVHLYVSEDMVFQTVKNHLINNAESAVQQCGRRLRPGQVKRRARMLRKALQGQLGFPLRWVNGMVQCELKKAIRTALAQAGTQAEQFIAAQELQGHVKFKLIKTATCVERGYVNIIPKQNGFAPITVQLSEMKGGAGTNRFKDLLDNEGIY